MKSKPDVDDKFVHDKSDNNKQNEDFTCSDRSQSYYNKKIGNNYQFQGQTKKIILNNMPNLE